MAGWLVTLVAAAAWALPSAAAGSRAQPAAVCAVEALPGLHGQWRRAERDSRSAAAGRTGAALDPPRAADFSAIARAVLGPAGDAVAAAAAAPPDAAVGAPTLPAVPCGPSERERDATAWRMGLAGYSAREIADVLGGHLTLDDVMQARARLMAGHPRPLVAAFLDARWDAGRSGSDAVAAPAAVRPVGPVLALADLDADLEAFARGQGVPAGLVRAVVAAESGGDIRAVSPAGAIGLMQLMPGTAAALGVDPWVPRENLRGGIAYLAELLRAFDGDPRLALIAYNAGPGHARDVQAGRAVAYRETRAYLEAVGARFPLPVP